MMTWSLEIMIMVLILVIKKTKNQDDSFKLRYYYIDKNDSYHANNKEKLIMK